MAQNFTSDWYAQSANAHTAFGQAEANDLALKSNFSGASSPPDVVAGQHWYHTSKGMRQRNAANAAWLKALAGSANFKTWVYRNDTDEGWLIDSSASDRVLAIKGGSYAFNVAGGTAAGAWTVSGLYSAGADTDHTHVTPSHTHTGDTSRAVAYFDGGEGQSSPYIDALVNIASGGSGTTGGFSVTHAHTVGQNGEWRPAAAVGTLQYPDLS